MKYILALFSLMALISCSTVQNNDPEDNIDYSLGNRKNLIEKANNTKTEDSSLQSFPEWLKKLYPDTVPVDYAYYMMMQEIISFKRLNDSVTYCIYETNDGLCGLTFLATQVAYKEKQKVEIAGACDHDQSIPYYTWNEYKMINDTTFRSIEYTDFIPEKYLDKNGEIEEGKYYEDYELERETSFIMIYITSAGIIAVDPK